jgi:hypothetical protein
MSSSVHSRAVQRAAQLVGGRQALADKLQLARPDIDAWIGDERRPDMAIFLRLVELILDLSEPSHR